MVADLVSALKLAVLSSTAPPPTLATEFHLVLPLGTFAVTHSLTPLASVSALLPETATRFHQLARTRLNTTATTALAFAQAHSRGALPSQDVSTCHLAALPMMDAVTA